ncbi:MAG TPA: hypothetical protein VNO33_02425 [Kofleriaceae bacterium]|nr:hypothetical protein [Kofleriaceae bacterium]
MPFWAALLMIGAVVMGPSALTPAGAVDALDSSRGLRLGLWGLWVAGTVPAARAALARPDLLYLRAMPIAPALWWLCLAVIALAVQAPWVALFWAGGGAAAGVAAGLGAAGLGMSLSVRAARRREMVIAIGLGGAVAALIAVRGPDWALALAGGAALAGSLPIAWRRAPEAAAVRRGGPAPIGGPIAIALAMMHALGLWRRDRGSLARGLILALTGGALTGLLRVAVLGSLAIGALTMTAAVFGLVAPVARARREAGWLLDSTGASRAARTGAAALVLIAWGAVAGVGHAAVAQVIGAGDAARGLAALGLGVGLALAAIPTARWADRPGGVDGTRVVTAATLVAIALLVVLSGVAAARPPGGH